MPSCQLTALFRGQVSFRDETLVHPPQEVIHSNLRFEQVFLYPSCTRISSAGLIIADTLTRQSKLDPSLRAQLPMAQERDHDPRGIVDVYGRVPVYLDHACELARHAWHRACGEMFPWGVSGVGISMHHSRAHLV